MSVQNLRDFASERGLTLQEPGAVAAEVERRSAQHYPTAEDLKAHFDDIITETHDQIYLLYQEREKEYGARVLDALVQHLLETGQVVHLTQVGTVLGEHFNVLDRFFLSLAQGRKSRAGKAFERIHNSLFKRLGYPFNEQPVIDGKPDFVLPSIEHYRLNPMDCLVFTTKRTIRERWRQIVTEGTRGLGFYLATLDSGVSSIQLSEMLRNRIYLVCPRRTKDAAYSSAVNVLSFSEFFEEHLDPAMHRWQRRNVI